MAAGRYSKGRAAQKYKSPEAGKKHGNGGFYMTNGYLSQNSLLSGFQTL